MKHNGGWRRDDGAKADLLVVPFDVPEHNLPEALDWSHSNGSRLFEIGCRSAQEFLRGEGASLLGTSASAPPRSREVVRVRRIDADPANRRAIRDPAPLRGEPSSGQARSASNGVAAGADRTPALAGE